METNVKDLDEGIGFLISPRWALLTEQKLSELHRTLAAIMGQYEAAGQEVAAERLRTALWSLGAAIAAAASVTHMARLQNGDCTYLLESAGDDHTAAT